MSEEDDDEIVDININETKAEEVFLVVKVENRIYCNTLSLTECVSVICDRADQINKRAKIFTNVNDCDAHDIAIKEIIEGKCPLSIKRLRGRKDGKEYIEEWSVNELEKSEKLIDKIQTVFDRSEKYNIRNRLMQLKD